MTMNAGNCKIYVNGTDATVDSTMDAPVDYTNALTIGNLSSSSTGSFGGYIDNFQYYPYALTDAQIDSLSIMSNGFCLGQAAGFSYSIPTKYNSVSYVRESAV
jgi:hypothetical protein